MTDEQRAPRRGRPPAGTRPGEKVKDYPQIALRLPAEIKQALRLLSVVRHQPQWRIICDAIDCYLRELPQEERRKIAALSNRHRRGK